jgi:hypothetical protein
MKILTKERVKEIEKLRKKAKEALKELIKETKNKEIKEWYKQVLYNIENIPVGFFPRKVLSARIAKIGNRLIGSIIKGQQVSSIQVMQIGKNIVVKGSRWIELPADLVFKGNHITMEGIMTLMHEYSHFPRKTSGFAKAMGLSHRHAEELIADLVSAKVARKMGLPKEEIKLIGLERVGYYGRFPFKELFEKAIK